MFFRQYYLACLSHASYLIGDTNTGRAVVVDPQRDISQYLEDAKENGLTIERVIETHFHADFLSGHLELQKATGAVISYGTVGAERAEFPVTAMKDGERLSLGEVTLEVMNTPGHTPESISTIVYDKNDVTYGVLTGDTLFIGDVGRPDLLSAFGRTQDEMARSLYSSLRERLLDLPDTVQVWPGHGAGSACGKALGAVPTSTVGYEKRFNWGVAETDAQRFVATILEGQPEPPRYFAEMKRMNREGPRILHGFIHPERVAAARIAERAAQGAQVVDLRPAATFAAGHLPRTLSIPLNKSFATWAGWLLAYGQDIHLVAESAAQVDTAVRELAMIGLDQVASYTSADALGALATATVPQTTAEELVHTLLPAGVTLIDVRGRAEWEAGHIPGARHVHVGALTASLRDIPSEGTVVLQCQGGARSAIAAALLQAHGRDNVVNLQGGYAAWERIRQRTG